MNTLLETLESFNAKERFFLLGEITGNPKLSPTSVYLDKISKVLRLRIGEVEFSAMDYHLDWIYASLERTSNPGKIIFKNIEKVIRGHQEDVDFVIGYVDGDMTHLVFIEAKAATGWTNKQLKSKVGRLIEIFGLDGKKYPNVTPHFVITSPKLSPRIDLTSWPSWMKVGDAAAWIELKLPENIPSVTRCDDAGVVTHKGEFWKITNR